MLSRMCWRLSSVLNVQRTFILQFKKKTAATGGQEGNRRSFRWQSRLDFHPRSTRIHRSCRKESEHTDARGPSSDWKQRHIGRGPLREYEILVTIRNQGISSRESWAKLEHSETLKVAKDKKECYILTIQMPGGAQKQKLWVDKTEFTIWKSEDTTVAPWGNLGGTLKKTVTLTTEQMTLNPPLDDNNFVFTPPDQTKRVDSLILSGSNPF